MGYKKGEGRIGRLKGLWGAWMFVVTVLFFIGTLVLVNHTQLYVSPDETANAYFARQFAHTGALQGPEQTLQEQFERLQPRSTVVSEGQLLPGSFLGLPFLYGAMAMVLGDWVLWVLTPLLTIVTAYGFFRLVERYTSSSVGLLSYTLFLLHPAVWYYSARGLMHNVLFLDLLILAVWLWVCRPLRASSHPRVWNDVFAGLSLGLALSVRTSELMWVMVVVCVAGVVWWRTLSWRRVRAGVLGLMVGLAVLFTLNTLTYGHPLTTGYTVGAPLVTDLVQGETTDAIELLPFGFHPMNAWRHLWAYGIGMFWWLSVLTLPGLVLLLQQKKHRSTIIWSLMLASAVSVWLVVMYGSWEIHDNPDPTQVTMANSYVRYWLPMYVFCIPMVAMTIHWFSQRIRWVVVQRLCLALLVLGVIGLNVHATFMQGQDGLLKMRTELADSAQIQASVLRYTELDAVVIVDRGDKLFFPHRHVWYPLRDDATYEAMPQLLQKTSLYYYGITFPQEDLDYLNQSRLGRMGLGIELVETYKEESLYRIMEQE